MVLVETSDSRNGTKWLRLGESGSYHYYRFLVLAMTAVLAMQGMGAASFLQSFSGSVRSVSLSKKEGDDHDHTHDP